jgi:hypothetical protein
LYRYSAVFVWRWRLAAAGGASWAAALVSKANGATGAPPTVRGVAWDMFPSVANDVDDDGGGDDDHAFFLSFGVKHVKVWTPPINGGDGYVGKKLLFNGQASDTAVSALFLPPDPIHLRAKSNKANKQQDPSPMLNRRAVTGMASGCVYVWDLGVRACLAAVSAHGVGAGTAVRSARE